MDDAARQLWERLKTREETTRAVKQLQEQSALALAFWELSQEHLEGHWLATDLLRNTGNNVRQAVELLKQQRATLSENTFNEALDTLLPHG